MLIDNETVYDEQISPLMAQIIKICKDNKIPMFATFCYQQDNLCTTSMPPSFFKLEDEVAEKLINKLYNEAYKQPEVFAFTIISKDK